MDVSELLESEFLSCQFIKDSNSKTGVILSAGVSELSKDGNYKNLKVLVEIDGKQKYWKINKTSLKNLSDKWGKESSAFVGKKVLFQIITLNSKESILSLPQ